MIFQHSWEKVLNGKKTQTRRIVKPIHHPLNYWRTEIGDVLHFGSSGDGTNIGVVQASGRDMWRVYSDYAVQPGRGKASVARIMITRIQREDVRNISNEDVRAEGYSHVRDFLHVWCGMHDPSIENGTWGETKLMSRPADRYQAWVLTFDLFDRSSHLETEENAQDDDIASEDTLDTVETLESEVEQ